MNLLTVPPVTTHAQPALHALLRGTGPLSRAMSDPSGPAVAPRGICAPRGSPHPNPSLLAVAQGSGHRFPGNRYPRTARWHQPRAAAPLFPLLARLQLPLLPSVKLSFITFASAFSIRSDLPQQEIQNAREGERGPRARVTLNAQSLASAAHSSSCSCSREAHGGQGSVCPNVAAWI